MNIIYNNERHTLLERAEDSLFPAISDTWTILLTSILLTSIPHLKGEHEMMFARLNVVTSPDQVLQSHRFLIFSNNLQISLWIDNFFYFQWRAIES